jgi:hypothetical protein
MAPSDRHGGGSDHRRRHIEQALGAETVDVVEVTTAAFQRSQRTVLVTRIAVFALGFALAFTVGVGWVVLSFGAVAHHFLQRSRQVLVATESGLHLVTVGPRSAQIVRQWTGATEATLTLRPGAPDIELTIDEWAARVSGVHLDSLESTIRAGGGEPLRVVDRS